jgi:hypothetical protein
MNGNNEVVYIKLNGCKTDLSQYKLVFSTQDFLDQSPYYRAVLTPFRQFTSDIIYIAFGYSFSDEFAESLLEKLISNDFRQKRKVYCVDPFVNTDNLDYFESKGIIIIKETFVSFFKGYQKWFEDTHKDYLKSLQKFANPDKTLIKIEATARLYLDNNLIQLKDEYRVYERMRKQEFYSGSEPTYQVIIDNYDVVRLDETVKLILEIKNAFNGHPITSIPKLILVSGDFGTGKTTFTLRAIREFLQNDNSTIAFEITKGLGIKKGYLAQLIKEASANQFIFYSDNIETDSVFKRFNEIRTELAAEQYSDKSIVFISSIRENILGKLRNHDNFSISNLIDFHYKSNYTERELNELVENLKEVGLLRFRDKEEKKAIVFKLKNQYLGDSFISLYTLCENGTHVKFLKKAYEELTPEIQIAFKVTALVHRFGMECPASIIKHSIKNMEWGEFTDKVIRGDGKNILIQEKRNSTNNDPDLFFKTKHPVIAEALIQNIMKNTEKNALYKNLFSGLSDSEYNGRFVVDLIKNIRNSDSDITKGQIENYYEICKKEFNQSIPFMLSYITNIEKQTESIQLLEKCIDEIEMIEAPLTYRNNRLIHRKGSLNFKIARILFRDQSVGVSTIKEFLYVAEDWFKIKKELDQSSTYSYMDYFNLLIWKLRNLSLDDKEKLVLHLTINDLFDEAFRMIEHNKNGLIDLYEEYNKFKAVKGAQSNYLEYLLEQYQIPEQRAIACMLLYYYYEENKQQKKLEDLISELVNYQDLKEVVYFLFKYYGRNLYSSYNRTKFFSLIRYNSFLRNQHQFRYFYYSYVCDAYDRRWGDSNDYLNDLRFTKVGTTSPDFFLYWCAENGKPNIFEGEIVMDRNVKKVKISTLYKDFVFVKGNYRKYEKGQFVDVKLRFSFEGIRAEIVG